jgi:hypothetical protein
LDTPQVARRAIAQARSETTALLATRIAEYAANSVVIGQWPITNLVPSD